MAGTDLPGLQERGSQDEAPGEIGVGIEEIDRCRLDERGWLFFLVSLIDARLLPPRSVARSREIDEQKASSRLEQSAGCRGYAVQHQQDQQHDRAVAQKRRQGCGQRSYPALFGDARQKIGLERAWLYSRSEGETACDDEVFEHVSRTFYLRRELGGLLASAVWRRAARGRVPLVIHRRETSMQRHPCEPAVHPAARWQMPV